VPQPEEAAAPSVELVPVVQPVLSARDLQIPRHYTTNPYFGWLMGGLGILMISLIFLILWLWH
jgi:hypothetical protein